jgi:hypothetical protein
VERVCSSGYVGVVSGTGKEERVCSSGYVGVVSGTGM